MFIQLGNYYVNRDMICFAEIDLATNSVNICCSNSSLNVKFHGAVEREAFIKELMNPDVIFQIGH